MLTGLGFGFALGLAVATRSGAVRIETSSDGLTNRIVIDQPPLRQATEQ
jgi:hypothetical protein